MKYNPDSIYAIERLNSLGRRLTINGSIIPPGESAFKILVDSLQGMANRIGYEVYLVEYQRLETTFIFKPKNI